MGINDISPYSLPLPPFHPFQTRKHKQKHAFSPFLSNSLTNPLPPQKQQIQTTQSSSQKDQENTLCKGEKTKTLCCVVRVRVRVVYMYNQLYNVSQLLNDGSSKVRKEKTPSPTKSYKKNV